MADATEPRPLAVGDVIHGFAYGAFGRDHYQCVRIEATGPDWIVARNPNEPWREPSFTSGQLALELCAQARDDECSNARDLRLDGNPHARCPLTGSPAAQPDC